MEFLLDVVEDRLRLRHQIGERVYMKTLRYLTVLLAALALFGAGAAEGQSGRTYSCTLTISSGRYAYGVVFNGSNQTRLIEGCRIFAQGGQYRLRFGLHPPSGWVISAEYINPDVQMSALLIAPSALKDLMYRVTNRAVFTQHGWIFVRRG